MTLEELHKQIYAAEADHILNGMLVDERTEQLNRALAKQTQSRDRLQGLRKQLIEAEQFSMEAAK